MSKYARIVKVTAGSKIYAYYYGEDDKIMKIEIDDL